MMNEVLTESVESLGASGVDKMLDRQDWQAIEDSLGERGYAVIKSLFDYKSCAELIGQYSNDSAYRKRVVMQRHGFGRGEYKYYSYPLPGLIADARTALFRHLSPIANRWNKLMGIDTVYPAHHREYLMKCHAAGQSMPTPLILAYEPDDYNCLHQDLYGEFVFPLQMAVLLSEPGVDHEGGEFVITEQRPRMQSKVEVVQLSRGDAVIFAVHHKPVKGTKGIYRVNLRHGVSRITHGKRHALGIILHDAQT